MTTWLHCVGASYYTQARFIREAMKYGITRRVSLANLKRMAYGDRILLAMKDGASLAVFGYYVLDTLSGLTLAGMEAVRAGIDCAMVDPGGKVVERGCGDYIEGPTYLVTMDLAEMAKRLDQVQDPGKLMVGGQFHELPPPLQVVRLRDVRHSMGFRAFAWDAFLAEARAQAAALQGSGRSPMLAGHFYADQVEPLLEEGPGLDVFRRQAQEVRSYSRKVLGGEKLAGAE